MWKNDHSDPDCDKWIGHAMTVISVDYDDDGNPIVTIDHTESRTGGCHSSWKNIAKLRWGIYPS